MSFSSRGNSPPHPRGQLFFSTHGEVEGVYFHCLTGRTPPSSPAPAPKWTEGSEKEVRRKGTRVLGVSTLPTLHRLVASSPLAIFPPPSLPTHWPASLNPDPIPTLFPLRVRASPPFQGSAGGDEGPHTDLKEPGATITSSQTAPDPTAGEEGGLPDWCPHLRPDGHVSAASPELGSPPPGSHSVTPIPKGPSNHRRCGGRCGKGGNKERAGSGRRPDRRCFTWSISGPLTAAL